MTMPPEKTEQLRQAIIGSQNAMIEALAALTDYLPEDHPVPATSLMELHFAQHQQEQREGNQSA